MKKNWIAAAGICTFTLMLSQALGATKATGFWGTVEGTVKTAKSDGTSFTIVISSATPDAKQGTIRDGALMVGKTLTLGTRMPKKDGKAGPHPDDVAYIKTLKAGDKIRVKIFTVISDASVTRIQAPGEKVK